MSKTPDNFIKKLKKLNNCFVLREESEYFIVATTTTIKEHIEIHNTFSTYSTNKDKEFYVFFILGLNEDCVELNEFRKKKIPILILPKNISAAKIDVIERYINDFIKIKF